MYDLWYSIRKSPKEVQRHDRENRTYFRGGVTDVLKQIDTLPLEVNLQLRRTVKAFPVSYSFTVKRSKEIEELVNYGYLVDVTDNRKILEQEYDRNALFSELSKRTYDITPKTTTTKKDMIDYILGNEKALQRLAGKYIEVEWSDGFQPHIREIEKVVEEIIHTHYSDYENVSMIECYEEMQHEKERAKTESDKYKNLYATVERVTPRTDGTTKQADAIRKSKTIALILCIFGGYFGLHYFYAGKTGIGILYLCTVGLFGVGWLVDIVRIATGKFKDKDEHYLK